MSHNVPSQSDNGTKSPKKLTYKQNLFVKYYKGNGSDAALKAGYSAKNPHVSAAELLSNPKIRQAIEDRDSTIEQIKRDIMSAEEIREQWSILAVTAEKESDRLKALELLAKAKGMFIERSIQLSGSLTDLSDAQLGRKLRGALHNLDIPPILLEQLAGRMPVIGNTTVQDRSTIDTITHDFTDIADNPASDNVDADV